MRRPRTFSQAGTPTGRGYTLNRVRRLAMFLVLAVLVAFPAGALASLSSSLKRQMRGAGPYSGAMVVDASTGKTLFGWKSSIPRVLASNTKLFTTAAALARFGVDGTLATEVLSNSAMNPDGVIPGD